MGSTRTPHPQAPWAVPISLPCLVLGWGVSPGVWAMTTPRLPLSLPTPRAVLLEKAVEDGLQVVALGGKLSVPGFVGLHLVGLLQRHSRLWTSSLRIKYGLLGTAPHAGLGARWEGAGPAASPGL